ncbi:hypothetical protein PN497_13135 [Sphaerospermopsis kisseleviana CS-549]|uniref:DUF4352 domain-containing protein n=1 Tax=Sphaerospermopsis kisseleviana CS-549 TaxID=3021783 RepID=A0ABT4ZU91_9CYAN|nr:MULTISPECIES: hypothetical protein [Sphaerospermopsis]MBD2147743.1 hypothetical protein [Sphaerospermopsis sp. FACHB-1194]MDB9442297.1 hypothetical protein [Sphaerospermopsis kisseleviana CS-549]BAZ79280.1 hypothetical protein NIES73_05210 [Sphaerospermopsis kisseleviana NIES-73]
MKINSTVVLTLILLTLMLGAGSVSAFLGFSMGSSALKGVSSPDGRPTSKFASNRNNNAESDRVNLLKEEDIIKAVKARMQDNKTDNKAQKREEEEEITAKKSEAAQKREEVAEEKLEPGFPVVAESEGVTMSVQSVRYSGGDLILRVKMQNQANDTVRFLYSFLDVTDDKGRTLSAITEGLPAELPGKGPTFTGTISIPTALLDDVSSVSLALTDYPAQKLKLQVSDIPVEK